MKGFLSWLIAATVGFGLMAFSYFNYQHESNSNPWKDAFMYIGKGRPQSEPEGVEYVARPIRLLPVSGRAENFMHVARGFGPNIEKSYRMSFQEKVILYSGLAADFTDQTLEWGRFPTADANEAVAGFHARCKDEITMDGHVFKVVGQFKKGVRLFADSYLLSDSTRTAELFNPDHEPVQTAYILQLPADQLADSQIREHLEKAFPKSQYTTYVPLIRTQQNPFYLYVAGLILLFLGGCLVLFRLYCSMADRLRNTWLGTPLAEIRRYKHLFLTLHLIYFGAIVIFMFVSYLLPELQVCLLSAIRSQVTDGSGPLGVAGKAYMSKSIPLAAVTTFVINFFFGSLAVITLPSVILPGVGVLVAGLRAMLWGLLLAPTSDVLSRSMLPHSLTLLLEGEAYVIAAFFALLIPVFLFRRAEGSGIAHRYGKALLLNLKGNLLVAIVLTVAAIYEAIEVILAMG
ncbi:MAG TPA: hypothetical protein VMW24_08145 [Sedimentisphaerales bacterium]|nr:hypothetical protein [Sedimentisphaerales bacterium]